MLSTCPSCGVTAVLQGVCWECEFDPSKYPQRTPKQHRRRHTKRLQRKEAPRGFKGIARA